MTPNVVAFIPDLMDRSRVEAAVTATQQDLGSPVVLRWVSSPDELVAASRNADLAILDLQRGSVLQALSELVGVNTVGFASHVDESLIREARSVGCRKVLARSTFFHQLPQLMAELFVTP